MDSSNEFEVGASGVKLVIHRLPLRRSDQLMPCRIVLTRAQAIKLAAWLVALAEQPEDGPRFMDLFMEITEGAIPNMPEKDNPHYANRPNNDRGAG